MKLNLKLLKILMDLFLKIQKRHHQTINLTNKTRHTITVVLTIKIAEVIIKVEETQTIPQDIIPLVIKV